MTRFIFGMPCTNARRLGVMTSHTWMYLDGMFSPVPAATSEKTMLKRSGLLSQLPPTSAFQQTRLLGSCVDP